MGRLSVRALIYSSVLALVPVVAAAQDYVPGEVIVKLKGKATSMSSNAFVGKAVTEKAMNLKGSWSGLNMHHFALKPGQDVKEAVRQLQADPDVEYAEPNYIIRKQSAGMEGQPMSMGDFQAMAGGGSMSQTGAPIQAEQAWAAASSGLTEPVVAIIDTGLDYDHPVFVNSGAVWSNSDEIAGNNIDDDRNGYVDDVRGWNFVSNSNDPMDDDGHGTHVSGIVLGATQDIRAATLSAAKIRIMPLKFLDATGSGSTSDAIRAIYYAVNNGAKVLNNSWGGGGFSNALLEAITYAYDRKTVFVAAAGNATNNNDSKPTYPANYSVPNVLSIAATSDYDTLASFSNYGARTVHMGSPGVSILSTVPNSTFQFASGTSMAAPFVSGVAALMVREAPTMNGYQVKNLIFGGTDSVSSLRSKTTTESRLNAYEALMAAKTTAVDPDQPAYNASSYSREPAAEAAKMAGGCGLVMKQIMDGEGGGPAGPHKTLAFFALLLVLVAPIMISVMMRAREGRNRRRHERFVIDSEVRVRVGDRELLGSVSSISLGGVQLNTSAMLEQGGIITMTIASPDGKEQVQVQGKVVWSESQKAYGVQFADAPNTTLATISQWTRSLVPQ